MRRAVAAVRNSQFDQQPEEIGVAERRGIHKAGAASRGVEHPAEFLGFLGQRLNLNESDAVEMLGRLLSEYRTQANYEISVLGPVRKCGERFEP